MALPTGFVTRPLEISDSAAVFELMAAGQLIDAGEVSIEEADLVADWQVPGFDLAGSSIAVVAGDRIVGYAEVGKSGRGDAAVHPDHRGCGIGTFLARWMQDKGRELGCATIGMPVPQNSAGDRLLAALGYHVRWTSWVLQLPEGAEVQARTLPDGYDVRAARPEEYERVHDVIEDAFLEWSVREREPFGWFEAQVLRRPGFEPWTVRVVTDQRGDVVATAIVLMAYGEGYIQQLATRRDQRNRGLAQALLVDAFAVAREHGATRSGLSTDSRTGALGLYEKVGMVVTQTWVNRAIDV